MRQYNNELLMNQTDTPQATDNKEVPELLIDTRE